MFNLTRQLGGSLGIAIMATLLTRFTAQKKALLTEHLTTMDPTTLGRLESDHARPDHSRHQPDRRPSSRR